MAVANDDLVAQGSDRPCGYARYATQLTSAINLETAPTNGAALGTVGIKGKPRRLIMQCEAQDVRWTDDPLVDPTAAIGMLLKVGVMQEYDGDISRLRFFQAAATAILNISYYN